MCFLESNIPPTSNLVNDRVTAIRDFVAEADEFFILLYGALSQFFSLTLNLSLPLVSCCFHGQRSPIHKSNAQQASLTSGNADNDDLGRFSAFSARFSSGSWSFVDSQHFQCG